MIKKITGLALALVLLLSSLAGCGAADNKTEKNVDGKLQIIATIFPEYDWVKNILGENPAGAETTLLLNNGVDLHSFQPTAADIMKISECDLFIYVGGESDEWVEDALKEAMACGHGYIIDCVLDIDEKVKPMVSSGDPITKFLIRD